VTSRKLVTRLRGEAYPSASLTEDCNGAMKTTKKVTGNEKEKQRLVEKKWGARNLSI